MANLGADPEEEDTFGELFGRLVDDGDALVRAELNFQRQIVLRRLALSRSGLVLVACAAVIASASITALLVGLVIGLAELIGPYLAGLAVGVAGLAVAAFMVHTAIRQIGIAFAPLESFSTGAD